ncbi:MAG: RimK family alpha-L-glutamate ligase [Methylophilaceae bacterium]
MRIPIFTDEVSSFGGWHGHQLSQAFAKQQVEAVFVSLKDCVLDFSGNKPAVDIPHFDGLPKAAFVRGIAGGSLQQVTTRLNVLHILNKLGVQIYNDGKAIERTVDKGMTSFLLLQAGISTPKTWVCESRQMAHQIINQRPQLVIKPLFGSQGLGVRLVDKLKSPLPMDTFVDGVYYLQAFIRAKHDYRVFLVNHQPVSAMRRMGEGWLHNVAQGAKCEFSKDSDVLDIAVRASKALDIAYCGVDVIRDENDQLLVLEVNSIPAWRGLQKVSELNIAQTLADDFLKKLATQI